MRLSNPNSNSKKNIKFIHRVYFNETMPSSNKNEEAPLTGAQFRLGDQSVFKLLQSNKQWRRSLARQEIQASILQNEEHSLLQRIRKLKKKCAAQQKVLAQQDQQLTILTPGSQKNKAQASQLPQCNTLSRTSSKFSRSLYQDEKNERIQGIKRHNLFVKTLIADRKSVHLQQRRNHVSEYQQKRSLAREQVDLVKVLRKLKVSKQKQNDALKYSQLNLQSQYKQAMLQENCRIKQLRIENLKQIGKILEERPDLYRKVRLKNPSTDLTL